MMHGAHNVKLKVLYNNDQETDCLGLFFKCVKECWMFNNYMAVYHHDLYGDWLDHWS